MAENQIQEPLGSCGDMNSISWKCSVPRIQWNPCGLRFDMDSCVFTEGGADK